MSLFLSFILTLFLFRRIWTKTNLKPAEVMRLLDDGDENLLGFLEENCSVHATPRVKATEDDRTEETDDRRRPQNGPSSAEDVEEAEDGKMIEEFYYDSEEAVSVGREQSYEDKEGMSSQQ